MSTLIFSCADFDYRKLEDETYEIQTASHVYRVGKNERLDALFRDILPRLNGTAPPEALLSDEDLQALYSVAGQLMKMGILFSVELADYGGLENEADRQLYTLLARTKENPLDSFVSLKQLTVRLAGHQAMIGMLHPLLAANSCNVVAEPLLPPSIHTTALDHSLVIVLLAHTQKDQLTFLNKHFHTHKIRWVPVLFYPDKITIGPWIWPERSSCLCCMNEQPKQSDEQLSPAALGGTFFKGWLSCQPNALQWVAGVVSMQINQAFCSLTKQTPWGRVIEFDCQQLSQTSKRVWKQPACPVCTDAAIQPQLWVEVTQ